MVLGGLDDTHSTVCDFFTNYCYELRVLKFNQNEEMYVCNPKSAMFNGRGCFGACLNDNFVYVMGGVNGRNFNHGQGQGKVSVNLDVNEDEQVTPEDGLMSACEKYDFENDQWY